MRILVQKFGGTSLATDESRAHVLRHITRELEQGIKLVVVVSAMGRAGAPYATDTLLALLGDRETPQRERDLLLGCGEIISAVTLCAALGAAGISSGVLTGGQAGIVTDSQHGQARIVQLAPAAVLRMLENNVVAIVAGFQGQSEAGELTTLGRGGSDTSAAALGAALHAERIDIYTDVDGILTSDPRLVANARPLEVVSYEEICNLAQQGAKVIHPRAVQLAQQAGVPLRVRSTFSDAPGTLVTHLANAAPGEQTIRLADRRVTGIAHVENIVQLHIPTKEQQQLEIFKMMATHGISVDFINVQPGAVIYTVEGVNADKAVQLLERSGLCPQVTYACAKVSVIGGGMNGEPGIMADIVEALALEDIPILQSADSNRTIWVLVRQAQLVAALRALHAQFGLHL